MKKPLVSVIVPTKNSEDFLENCLKSIKQQTYKNVELIVVDNNSTDRTKEIAEKYTKKVYNQGPERSAQRNFGAKKSKGKYFLFVDSDMELSHEVIESCVSKVSNGKIKLVVIPEESFGQGFWAQCKKLERSFYLKVEWIEAARFYEREIFLEMNGYDENIIGEEDFDLPQRIKSKHSKQMVGRINKFIYHNEGELSLLRTIRKKSYYALALDNYKRINTNAEYLKKQSSLTTRYKMYFSNPKKLFFNPIIGIGMLLMKTCEFGFAGLNYHFGDKSKAKQQASIQKAYEKAPKLRSKTPLVSVIIACKNNAEYIEKSLESVLRQTYKKYELIIVDNYSNDGTFEIAKKYTSQVYQLGPERSTQFNYGFKKSRGELIYRIGAEFVLEPDVIEKCVNKIKEGYDALAVHNRSKGESLWAQVRYLERESYRNDDTIVAVRFMRRSVFKNIGMFDEDLIAGEDFDLHNRIVQAGYKWKHVDAVEYHLGEPKNIREVWEKFYYYGKTIKRYQEKNKAIAKKQFVFFRPSFLRILRSLILRPNLFIAFFVYIFVKNTAGFVGILYGYPGDLKKGQPQSTIKNILKLLLIYGYTIRLFFFLVIVMLTVFLLFIF